MRTLLSPRWLGRHLFMLAAIAALVLLGRWQWGRAMSNGGTLQNFGYAVEWVGFAAAAAVGWWRWARDDLRDARRSPQERAAAREAAAADPLATLVPRRRTPPPPEPEDADEELAAYNAYLARLNANPRS